MLTYLDTLNNKLKLSLKMPTGSLYIFKQTIYERMDKYENPVREKYREKKESEELAIVGAAVLTCPLSWPFIPAFFLWKEMKKHPAFAKAFFSTVVPVIILMSITMTQVEGLGYTALGDIAVVILFVYLLVLIPTFIVFLFLRRKQIAAGIVLSFGIGLPIAFVLLFIG